MASTITDGNKRKYALWLYRCIAGIVLVMFVNGCEGDTCGSGNRTLHEYFYYDTLNVRVPLHSDSLRFIQFSEPYRGKLDTLKPEFIRSVQFGDTIRFVAYVKAFGYSSNERWNFGAVRKSDTLHAWLDIRRPWDVPLQTLQKSDGQAIQCSPIIPPHTIKSLVVYYSDTRKFTFRIRGV